MKRMRHILISFTIIINCCVVGPFHTVIAQSNKSDKLYLVKRIYVTHREFERAPFDADALKRIDERYIRMKSYLEQELTRVGFEVVKDKEKADAVLSGDIGYSAVLEGPPKYPGKHFYPYRLTPLTVDENLWDDSKNLWRTEVYVRNSNEAKADLKAASKIVERLVKAQLKSAKKAGINTGNKI